MTTAQIIPAGTDRSRIWSGAVIDIDAHVNVPSLESLFPYQDKIWVQMAYERGFHGPSGVKNAFPPNAPTTVRDEWRVEGVTPASSLSAIQNQLLDPWRAESALISCYYAVDSVRHPDWAAALAQSLNDWLIAEYLERDPRLVGSIVVPPRDPQAAAAEIDRLGEHPRIKQVMLPVRSEQLYGQRVWHPMFEAISRNDLAVGIHWGGTPSGSPSTSGFPSWFAEEYAAETNVYIAQIISLIAEGVLRKYPNLRITMLDCGFTWVPMWGWRMNKEWKGLRREIPWVDRPPMDLLRDHFRFSIAPLDAGPPQHMTKILEWLGTDDFLMFGTDYPHRHDSDLVEFLGLLPESTRANVMSETARRWYRL